MEIITPVNSLTSIDVFQGENTYFSWYVQEYSSIHIHSIHGSIISNTKIE